MKIKHIAAIFLFFATFSLSVLIAGFPATQNWFNRKPCANDSDFQVVNGETDLQVRIRKFLEADHQTGIEFANDMARLSQSNNRTIAEKKATFNLVEKMKKVKCDGLPEDFCRAWDAHLVTWEYKAFLPAVRLEEGLLDHKMANDQIGSSYQKMLLVARTYGVDFKY